MSSEVGDSVDSGDTPPPLTKREDFLISLIVSMLVAGLVTSIVFGPIILVSVPRGAMTEPLEETAEIGQGKDQRWDFRVSDFRIRYTVKVIQGGNVDVYVSAFGRRNSESKLYIIDGHQHEDVNKIEGVVSPPDYLTSFYLDVDNSNETGITSDGNVTVKVKIENYEKYSTTWLYRIWGLVFLLMVVGLMRSLSKDKDKEGTTGGDDETSQAPSSPGQADYPTETVCQGCGGEYLIDEESGWPYCPFCNRWA